MRIVTNFMMITMIGMFKLLSADWFTFTCLLSLYFVSLMLDSIDETEIKYVVKLFKKEV